MRYGIFSDTHGNYAALQAVLREFERHHVDALACLGDSVGYGPLPNECCDLIRKSARFVIMGNHDAAVAGEMDYSYYYAAARQALDLHRGTLSQDNLVWLRGLPYELRHEDVHFSHGSPVNSREFDYIFSVEQAETCLSIWDKLARVTFIGHSHLCKSFAVAKDHGRAFEVVTEKFELRPDFRYVISVGSVGQPRDRDPRACLTIYDSDRETFEFVRVDYDIRRTANLIFATPELADSFGNRLFNGV